MVGMEPATGSENLPGRGYCDPYVRPRSIDDPVKVMGITTHSSSSTAGKRFSRRFPLRGDHAPQFR